jgi:hypothetical protein
MLPATPSTDSQSSDSDDGLLEIIARNKSYQDKKNKVFTSNAEEVKRRRLEYREDPINKARAKEKSYCNIHNCQKRFCTECMKPQDAIDKGLVCFICRENKTRHAICDECRGICRGNEPLRIEAIVG